MEKEATDNIKYVKKPKDRKSHSYASRHRQTLSGVEIKKKKGALQFQQPPQQPPLQSHHCYCHHHYHHSPAKEHPPPPVTDAGSGQQGVGRGRGMMMGMTWAMPHAAVAYAGSVASDSLAVPSASVGEYCDWLGTSECLLPRCRSPHPHLHHLHTIMHSAEEKS